MKKQFHKPLTNEQRQLASKLYADAIKTANKFYYNHRDICALKHITQDDLKSEAGERLCELVQKFDHEKGNFSAYLKISISGYLKNFTFGKKLDDNLDEHFEIGDYDITDEEQEESKKVNALLDVLPERRREVVCMRYGLGEHTGEMKIKDIASEMKISEGSVRQILQISLTEMEFSKVA